MTGFPILDHSLITRSRNRTTFRWRMALTVTGSVLCLGVLQIARTGGLTPPQFGGALFDTLALLGLAYCLLSGPVLTADCLSSEKRDGTLPLLFLTSLPSSNIALGKLAASSLPAIYGLVAFLPLPAIGFFLGGVTGGEVWRLGVLLITTLLLSLALGALVSAVSWSGRKALAATSLLTLVWLGLPWIWKGLGSPMPMAHLFPDPLHFLESARASARSAGDLSYFSKLVVAWFTVALFLIGTVLLLPRFLMDRTDRTPRTAKLSSIRFLLRRRSNLRERDKWYLINPVAWIARQRTPGISSTLVFPLTCAVVTGVALLASRLSTRHAVMSLAVVFCFHGLFKLWLAWETSRCLSRDQAEGLLEPLLAVPLSEHQIVHGWISGLQSVFRWPLILLVAMDLILWFVGDLGPERIVLVAWMGVLLFDAFTLLWTGVLVGLLSPNATRGLLRTIAIVLLSPWLLTLAVFALLGMLQAGWLAPGNFFVPCAMWVMFSLIVDGALCVYCSQRLGRNFRHLVAERSPG